MTFRVFRFGINLPPTLTGDLELHVANKFGDYLVVTSMNVVVLDNHSKLTPEEPASELVREEWKIEW